MRHFHPDAKMSSAQERNKELDRSYREMRLARDTSSWASSEAGSPDVCGVMAQCSKAGAVPPEVANSDRGISGERQE